MAVLDIHDFRLIVHPRRFQNSGCCHVSNACHEQCQGIQLNCLDLTKCKELAYWLFSPSGCWVRLF